MKHVNENFINDGENKKVKFKALLSSECQEKCGAEMSQQLRQ